MGLLGLMAAAALFAVQPEAGTSAAGAEAPETTVYFDYGRQDLGSAGLLLVRQSAARALVEGYTKATVIGHTDKAGSVESNLESGRERAEAVAAVLIDAGFSPDDVTVESAGESQPARKHEDERREPLNRRAVINFAQ